MPRVITQEFLKSLFHYDSSTGVFKRLSRCGNKIPALSIAGTLNHGYIRIRINGHKYAAHRLAWLYVNGHFPDCEIDHINRNPSDNRIDNLRLASHSENIRNIGMKSNNTSGFKGVTLHKRTGKWRATCRLNGKNHSLGLHSTKEEASAAFIEFNRLHYGEFFNKTGVRK